MVRSSVRPVAAAVLRVCALAGVAAFLASGALAASAHPPAASAAAKKQPDIVMIMTDDLDKSVFDTALALGYLPNIDREMIRHGTTFRNTFAALPMCCPSRTSYITGQYPHNHGVVRNRGNHGGFDAFEKDGSTVATWLHAAGYRTGLIGKYLNGYGRTKKSQGGAYVPPGWDTWDALFTVSQYNFFMSMNGVRVKYGTAPEDYQTDVLSGLAQAFLRDRTDPRPLFLTLTPSAPHYEGSDDDDDTGATIRPAPRYVDTPPQATIPAESLASFNEADMSDKPAWMQLDAPLDPVPLRAGFSSKIAALRAVDDMVGNVVATLRAAGKDKQTLLVFTSDNGFQYGTHRRTQKTDMYEESSGIPMMIRGPGQTKARVADAWAMNIDWTPTILDYARAQPDIEVDGQSLRPFVDTAAPGAGRRTVLIEHPCDGTKMLEHPPYDMIRSMDPQLTQDPTGQTVLIYAETYNGKNVLTDREFYNLTADPLQLESKHDSTDPLVLKQMQNMSRRLAHLKTCVGDECRALQH